MVQYKLYYFNAKGRAELVRLIFAAAGQEYEDVRIEGAQWPTHKPNTPLGNLPYLEIHDGSNVVKLSQSSAIGKHINLNFNKNNTLIIIIIARYLAKQFNLAGKNDFEIAGADMYAEQVNDLLTEMVKVHFEKDEAKKAELYQRLQTEVVPNNFKLFEDRLARTNSGYLIGTGLTWADLHLVNIIDWLGEKRDAALEHFPLLKKHSQTVKSQPGVAAWLAKRPETQF